MKVNLKIGAPNTPSHLLRVAQFILLSLLLMISAVDADAQCSGNIYDSGGSGSNYGLNENITTVLDAGTGMLMSITFNSFDVENNYDFLYVYDGATTSDPLIGTYTGTTVPPDITSTGQFLTLRFTSDHIVTRPGYSITLSCVSPPTVPECLVIAETNNGVMYSWTATPPGNTLIGTLNASNVEAMALNFDGSIIYAVDAGTFGTVDHLTGAFTSIATVGNADGALGTIAMSDVDGLAINPNNGLLMAVHRRGSDNDLFFAINPTTGMVEKNYFGPGVDYREIVGALEDMDDIAFHPSTNELFGISTVSNEDVYDQIVLIDQYYGTVTPISSLPTCDIEGLTFNNAGVLYGSSGFEECGSIPSNSIHEIDYSDSVGVITTITTLADTDTEALACFVSATQPCDDVVTGGKIGSYQAICSGDDVAAFTNESSATQNSGGTIEYQWFYSTTSCISPLNNDPNWIAIAGATSVTYDHGILTERTCFVRAAKSAGCPEFVKFSNVVTVDVDPCACPSPSSVTYSITSGGDDMEEGENGNMYSNSSDLELVYDTYNSQENQTVGLRFNNVAVPAYASVQSAKLIFVADESDTDPTTLVIEGELSGNSAAFGTAAFDLSSRPRTTSRATWSDIEDWTAGNTYSSVYFTEVVSEIIQQGTWSSGNSMTIILTGNGKRVAEAYEASSATAVQLVIQFCDQEICDNGLDDDGDGYTDSFDPDCPSYAPFDCDNLLLQSSSPDGGTTYYLNEMGLNPVALNQLINLTSSGMTASSFNAMAFNPVDRFVYGINPLKTGNYEMYRINADEVVEHMGNVTGLTGTNDAGCMAGDGSYYVSGISGRLFEINTSTLIATEIADLGFSGGDMAINPADGMIYIWNYDANQLYSVDPSNGSATAIGSPNTQYGEMGAMFFNEQGDLIAFGDDTSVSASGQETLVHIDIATGTITSLGATTEVTDNDGCSCAFGVGLTKEASMTTVEPGQTLSYTFTVHNRTGQTLSNITFVDQLPSGLTFSSDPYNITGLSLGSPSVNGTNSASFVILSIPPGESSFDLDVDIPVTYCDDISNQAWLQGLSSVYGTVVLSDDPSTPTISDATITMVGNCEEYWLEAECEDVGANWNTVTDTTASRDNYVTIAPGNNSLSSAPTSADDRVRFHVNITNAGDYNIFARVYAPNTGDDSFWVRANGGTWYKWNSLSNFASSGWAWGQVWNSDAGNSLVTFPLTAGANTIDFAYREDGTFLDMIKVALSDELPTGMGGISQNCPEICDNGEDDDGDGLTDCEDDDCSSEVYCQGPCDPGKLFVERWFNITGTAIVDLTSHANYPDSPDELDYVTSFQGPSNYANNYGTRVRGFIIPSETGTYTFNVTGDDNTILYLSTDLDEANKSEIASVTGWTGITEHNKYAVQTSAEIELAANVWYYVELIVKEGSGGDHFQAYWRTPSAPSSWNIIPGANLAPYICPEICDNGDDDDGDGLTDCQDPDCENGVNVYITSLDNEICVGETATLNAAYLGDPGPLTYLWSNGAGSTASVDVSPATTTTYVVTVTNENGCEATDLIQVTVNDLPAAMATNDGPITCVDTIIQLTASPAGLNYNWSMGGSAEIDTVSSVGTYSVTVTDANGCTNVASTTVVDDLIPPSADAGENQAICLGEDVTLTATGSGTFEWSHGLGSTASVTVTPLGATTYTVTVTGSNGCTAEDQVQVSILAEAEAGAIAGDETNCGGFDPAAITSTIDPTGADCGSIISTGQNSCDTGDRPISFTMIYNGENCSESNNNQGTQGDKWDCTGTGPNGDPNVYITVSDNQFAGDVALNASFLISNGGARLENPIFISVYDSNGGSLLQSIEIHTSCSVPIVIGDQFGSLILSGVVYENGYSEDGGTGGITHQWQSRVAGEDWMDISGENGFTYDPGFTGVTTEYRRMTTNCCSVDSSNIVTKTVHPVVHAWASDDEVICESDTVTLSATVGIDSIEGGFLLAGYPELVTNEYIEFTSSGADAPRLEVYLDNNPTPTIIYASATARIEGSNTDHNHSEPRVGYDSGQSEHERCLLDFDVSSLSGEVTQANLILNSSTNGNLTMGLYAIPVDWDGNDVSWDESDNGVSWSTPGVIGPGEDALSVQTLNGAVDMTWDVTGFVESWVNGDTHTAASHDYLWSNGETTQTNTVHPTSTTTYYVTVTNQATGCATLDSTVITVLPQPNASASNDGPLTCAQTSVTLTALPAGLTYLWSDGGTGQTTVVNTPGTYTVTITAANGCSRVASTVVAEDVAPPPANAGLDIAICIGDTTTLSASGGVSYQWSLGAGATADVDVSPSSTTTYSVTVTGANGCTAVDDVIVTVNPLPNASASDDGPVNCNKTSATLTAEPAGMSYQWSGGGTDQTKIVFAGGLYTVTVTDANGCSATASTDVVDATSPPNVDAGPDRSICIGDTITLTVIGGETYEWDDGSTSANRDVYPVTDTNYYVTVTGSNGCLALDTVHVVVNPLPTVSVAKDGDVRCDNPTVQLTASPSGMSYEWSTAETTETINVSSGGVYEVTVTDGNGCTNTAQINVDEFTTPTAIYCQRYRIREYGTWGSWIDFNGTCEFEMCEENGLSDIQFDGGPDLNTGWVWRDEDGNVDSEVDEIVQFTNIDLSDAGVYTGEYTNQYGCVSTISINVIVHQNPVASASNDGPITCYQPNVTMTALPAGMSYAWEGGGIGQTKTVSVGGTYTVTVTNANGCTDVATTVVVEDNTPPTADAGADVAICFGDTTTLVASGVGTYAWSHGGGSNASIDVFPTTTTMYTVTVTAPNGCTDVDSVRVTVNPLPVASASNDGPITCAHPNVTMTALPAGMSYTWEGGGTDQTKVVSVTGSYSVTVTDANGCTDVATTVVTDDIIPPTANAGTDDVICEADSIELTASGGVSYEWSHGAGNTATVTVSPSTTTTYTVTVTAANGCQDTDDITITVNQRPVASATNDGPITCAHPNVTMTAAPSGLSYAWEGGGTNETKIVSVPGPYSVTVTDGNGCTDIATTTVAIDTLSPPANAGSDVAICFGDTSTLIASGGVSYAWSHSAGNTATVDVNPTTTTTYTVTVTAANGCTDTDNVTVTVNPLPVASASNDGPITCSLPNVTLTALPAGMSYLWDGGSTDQTLVVSTTGSYSVTVTDANGCTDIASTTVTEDLINPTADAGSDVLICEGLSTDLTASGGVSYEWSHGAGNTATVTVSPIVTTTYTVTVTAANGCQDTDVVTVNVDPKPTVGITGSDIICIQTTTTLSPSTGGTWQSSDNTIAIVSSSGIVYGLNPGTASFTFTSSATGCASDATANVTVTPDISVNIDHTGGICLEDDTQLTANVTGGTMNFTYNWTGPNGFTASTETVSIFDSGNYYVTVTDAAGCSDNTSAYIYSAYEPFIFTLNTEVCEDEQVDLSVNSATAVSYQWSANAGGGTSQSVTVSPGLPSEDYYVTVTNDIGCTTEATIHIDVKPKTPVVVSGNDEICIGGTTNLSPSTGGIWTSSNNSIAGVTNDGTVTGLSAGTVTFTFLDSSTNCESNPTLPVTVLPRPPVSITGPPAICEGQTTTLSPATGGTWISNDPSIATVTDGGIVTGVSSGNVSFVWTNSLTGCVSNSTSDVTIYPVLTTSYTGPTEVCEGQSTFLSPTSGGTWVSNDTTIATVSNIGVVTTHSPGTVTFTFTSDFSCVSGASAPLTVLANDVITITGPAYVCEDDIVTLVPSSPGGTWASSNNTIATVNSSGQVIGIASGTATITYFHDPNTCAIDPTYDIVVRGKPTVSVNGPVEICTGDVTSVTASSAGGVWSSSDETVAIVSVDGTVVGLSGGTVSFTYTDTSLCVSDASIPIIVNPPVDVDIDFIGSVCLEEDTRLVAAVTGGTPSYTYSWSGPGGFNSTADTIDVVLSGLYNVLVTDGEGCSSNKTAYVYEAYNPFIFTLDTEICEGEDITLSVNGSSGGSYQWSTNAGSVTTQSVTVSPSIPGDTYYVTITSPEGCTTVANAVIDVEALPVATLTGPQEICVGQTTNFSPTTGGLWTSSDYSVASISNSGEVSALSAGAVTFTFRDTSSGCYSAPTTSVTVTANLDITFDGDNDLCMGVPETLTPSVAGGTWSSTDTGVATVSSTGEITPVAAGTASILYTPLPNSCYNVGVRPITVHNIPTVGVNGPSSICAGEITYLVPSSGGTWSSDDTTVAVVNNIGIVTGVSGGSANFTFTSTAGCIQTLSTPITVIDNPTVSLTGPSELCIDETTTLSPTSGGVWLSSNSLVASVSSTGVVLAKSAGIAEFTFIELVNGCISSEIIQVTVHPTPSITGLGANNICIGETTTIGPSSGGVWTSSNTSVATIDNGGVITGVGAGAATFTYTDAVTGCVSVASSAITVEGIPSITITGPTELCIGENSSILPSTGGVWSTSDISIATIANDGTITAVSAGSVTFTYTSNLTGCSSLASDTFTVNNPTSASVTGPASMCIGTTGNVTGSTAGTWSSSNSSIASVNSAGVVTANAPGLVTITLITTASCTQNPTYDILVEPNPNPVFTGSASICLGETTTLSPTSGGTWLSNNDAVATVDDFGNVMSVASGIVDFVFTDTITGCIATTATSLNIFEPPTISITGNTSICIGETTNLSPATGGAWSSSDISIATIDGNGLVTGISAGKVVFTFTETATSCVSEASDSITVLPRPMVSITGPTGLCIGSTSTLAPTTGGSWMSTDETVATVTDQGVVTAVSQGVARFTFISNDGCASNQTAPIVVYGEPSIAIDGSSELCVGDTVQMVPSSGGTWVSSNDAVATIANDGTVVAVSAGTAAFTYTDSTTGCVSDQSDFITVNPTPNTGLNGPGSICIGETTNFTPTTGGVWSSVDPGIATIENNGEVTGISSGTTRFIFTELGTGCISDTTSSISVISTTTPIFTGPAEICDGDTTYISPTTGGTWESTNTNVATVTNDGMIIGIAQGTAQFRFTNSSTGCVSDFSPSLTVNSVGTVFVDGNSTICIGTTTNLAPGTGGTWESLDPSVAVVDGSGVVTGISAGTANFVFTDAVTGCVSDGTLEVTVQAETSVTIDGEGELCAGYSMILSPTSGGFWTSNNEDIATITNSGYVTGKAPGKVTFTFTESSSGCVNVTTSDTVTVSSCKNHDFNVAIVDQEIFGNLSTNDNYPSATTYGPMPQLISKPPASIATFIINADGSYSFQGSEPGNYRYNVPVCINPAFSGCPTSMVEFTLVENQYSTGNPVTNLDIATMFANEDANRSASAASDSFCIQTIQNDVCVYTLGCGMDWATTWIDANASNGSAEIKSNGIIEYTPDPGFIGFDTIYYGMCADGYSNCNTTLQIITVNHSTAQNTVIAADDFIFTLRGNSVTGNVLLNDTDAEGDMISVTPQGSLMTPIVTSAGEYYIDASGNFEFTPNEVFSGHTEIIYEICDDNADQACMQATLHLLVFDDISVKLRVYLQGALMQNGGASSNITGRPLMRDDLRVSPFTGENYIPLMDPYTIAADPFVTTPSMFNKIGPGLLPENQEITDSLGVFSVTGDDAIVDWVHVELRSKADVSVPIATRSGLLQRDGDIVDIDGVSDLRFNAVNVDSFYVVIKHRSHLGVMSEKVFYADGVDFTDPSYPIYNFGVQGLNDFTGLSQNNNVKSGYSALWAGDFDSNGKIKFTNPGDDQNVLFVDVLFTSPDFLINYDQAYGYMTGDFNMDSKAKYTNPSDDINYLFSQILLYPLNSSFLSNYNSLIEQVPEDD